MLRRRLFLIPLALAVIVGVWFAVGYIVAAQAPNLGPAVIHTPSHHDQPSKPHTPTPRPSEASPVTPPAPGVAGECDPDDDPGDEDWCGPGYGDLDD